MFTANNKNSFKVAILGHRGIPNAYGGFETLAEELATCLVGLGCKVAVYCRKNYFKDRPAEYKGASLIYLPTITKKSLDTFFHTFISTLHVVFKNTADTVIVVNVGNVPSALLAKILGKKVILCVDGLDWQRRKWGKVARTYLRLCSYFAGISSHEVVTDAASVQDFYLKERKVQSTHIPYGTEIETAEPEYDVLKEYNLEYKKYFTYVARFEPENNPVLVVKAHAASKSPYPLVMIGDNRYNKDFVDEIKSAAGKNVIFTGYLFGSRYKQLVKNSLASVRAAEVGGLSPVVIEAMGRSSCIIANDKPENREPLGDAGLFFNLNIEDLAKQFDIISKNPQLAIDLGKKAAQRAMVLYSWDKIGYEYFKLVKKIAHKYERSEETVFAKDLVAHKKRILITGAGGVLGRALYDYFAKDFVVKATTAHPVENWLTKLDVTDKEMLEKEVETFRPDYIFHLAAMTNLEECEKDLPKAYLVNALSTKYLAQLSAKYGAKLVYTSSANVFNGSKHSYDEADSPSPLNVYGLTKHMGELMVEYYAPDFLILRLGWLIGGGAMHDKKFVAKIVEQILNGTKELHAVTDKYGTITYAPEVASTLSILLQRNSKGIYHVVSPGITNRFEIAQRIVKVLGHDVKVVPVTADYFATVFSTQRPKYECLRIDKLKSENINTLSNWDDALKNYLRTDYHSAFNLSPKINPIIPDAAIA